MHPIFFAGGDVFFTKKGKKVENILLKWNKKYLSLLSLTIVMKKELLYGRILNLFTIEFC